MKNSNLTSFRDHLDEQYGKEGTKSRTEYEEGFEAFKLGVLLQDLRTKEGMTQEELANRCGTTKSYISRIENNGDKEGIVNLPLAMKNVEISVLFTEDKGKIKISFRSKGDMNIEVLARNSFNGGGHKNASGGSSKESLEDTIKRFVSLLPEYLNSQNK